MSNEGDLHAKAQENFCMKFSWFGVPDTIVSDNVTQFTTQELGDFNKEFPVNHVTTALFYPRSTGQAEHFIDTFKWVLNKADGSETEDKLLQFLRR